MTTLLVLYRRPEGGESALAEFERRYSAEHLPLVADTPGLRGMEVRRVSGALGGETDLVLVTTMQFDDRAAMDAGLGIGRDAGRRTEPARDRPGSLHAASARRCRRSVATCRVATAGPSRVMDTFRTSREEPA